MQVLAIILTTLMFIYSYKHIAVTGSKLSLWTDGDRSERSLGVWIPRSFFHACSSGSLRLDMPFLNSTPYPVIRYRVTVKHS